MTDTSRNEEALIAKAERLQKALDDGIAFWREKQFQEPEVILLTAAQFLLVKWYFRDEICWANGLKYKAIPVEEFPPPHLDLIESRRSISIQE